MALDPQQLAAGQIPAIRFRIRDLQQVGRNRPAIVLAKTARNVMPGRTFRRGIKRSGANMLRLLNRFMLERTMQITLDIPAQYLIDQSPEKFGKRIKLYAALMMFQEESLSAGAASEFAGVDRFTFIAECQQHNIPLVDFSPEELDAELENLRKIA